jgi:hypothetical protein
LIAACSEPTPEVIARFPSDAGRESGSGEAGAGGENGAFVPVSGPRGRVKVVDGNLVSDRGTPLRGLLLPVDTGWNLGDYDFEFMTTLAQKSGLNAVHVYLENASLTTGSMEAEADALVSLTESAGMYLILGFGTGTAINQFDLAKLKSFWNLYAKRYASRTHVLFEIQNNPEDTCSANISAATLDMEAALYAQIRALAPDSHILLFSTTSLVQPSVFSAAVTSLGSAVDWSNASFTIDVTRDCLELGKLGELTSAAKAAGVPLLIGQLPIKNWPPYLTAFEQGKIGWIFYQWLARDADFANYVSAIESSGVSWCPDQGIFPEDSQTCP